MGDFGSNSEIDRCGVNAKKLYLVFYFSMHIFWGVQRLYLYIILKSYFFPIFLVRPLLTNFAQLYDFWTKDAREVRPYGPAEFTPVPEVVILLFIVVNLNYWAA